MRRKLNQWLAEEVSDLELCADIGDTVQDAAIFLERSELEVRKKALELGISLREEGQAPEQRTRRVPEN